MRAEPNAKHKGACFPPAPLASSHYWYVTWLIRPLSPLIEARSHVLTLPYTWPMGDE